MTLGPSGEAYDEGEGHEEEGEASEGVAHEGYEEAHYEQDGGERAAPVELHEGPTS